MTSTKYYLKIYDNEQSYTFDIIKDEEELPSSIHYYIGLAHKTYKACVHIEVDIRAKYAVLQGVATNSDCSMEGGMKTIHTLVKGSLKYVANKHTLKYFTLDDKAEKYLDNGKSIAITPRLLLQGKEGWYQHHFGAIPTQDSFRILQSLERNIDKIKKYLSITSQENWGDDEEITKIAEKIIPKYAKAIFATSWIIQADIVKKYDVRIEELQYGGGENTKKWNMFAWYMKKPIRRVRHFFP